MAAEAKTLAAGADATLRRAALARMQSDRDVGVGLNARAPSIWVVVKIMVPFWAP